MGPKKESWFKLKRSATNTNSNQSPGLEPSTSTELVLRPYLVQSKSK